MKPYEVELLVADVGYESDSEAELYHVLYDGVVMDEHDYSVLGGSADEITETLKTEYSQGMSLGDAVKLGAKVLGDDEGALSADQLEVALLDRTRPRRAFRRIKNSELEGLLG
jgi:proteasome alpha subunit